MSRLQTRALDFMASVNAHVNAIDFLNRAMSEHVTCSNPEEYDSLEAARTATIEALRGRLQQFEDCITAVEGGTGA